MIREDDTPAEMRKTLIANFETKEWSNTIYVLCRLCNLRYEPKMDMLKHIGKVRATIRELNDMGKTINEHETVEWILISLPDSAYDAHEIKLKTLISALLNEEEKRNERQRPRRIDRPHDGDIKRKRQIDDNGITSEINALQSKVRDLTERSKTSDDGKWCFICRRRSNHVAQDHTDFDPNYSKANVRQVTKQPAKRKSYKKSRETESSESEDGPSYDINTISDESSNIPLDGGKEQHWTLDNCATGHVTGVKEFVSTWHGPARLILPDKSEIYGQVGVAKIKLLENGRTTTINLNNVTYEPSLYKNLISHCRLLESGYRLVCQDNTETIYKNIPTDHELQFEMKNNLYVLKNVVTQRQTRSRSIHQVLGQSVNIHAITSEQPEQPNDDKLIAWHNKLNHTDMNQVAKIIKPIMNPKQDLATTTKVCHGCAQGQAKRISFRNTHHYLAPTPLQSLNADLCGPIRPATIHNETYTSMFIDQASRCIFGKLLKTKDDAIIHLEELTTTIDGQLQDSRISTLYSDGGGEYTSAAFKAACLSRGIRQNFTNADTPEENHLAEKGNEMVFNKIRVYMTLSGLPSSLWGYCFQYVIHVYNNTPQELLNHRTPYKVLYKKPSRLYMLKTFGCLAFKFVPKSQRASKLSNPAIRCVFVGYAVDQLGYKLWNPKVRTVTVSRSVKFDESKIRNADMFPNELFNYGRLSIPNFKSISGVESLEDLASQRFHSGSDDSRATSDVTEVNHEARSSTDTPEPRPKRQSRPPK
ncbi:hypothetical protein AeRB84_006344 [Aphanomyces euteiches]|nr:hypothetical protein AeRB84_006344 [Aphanomyces euteiches]